MGFCLRLSVLGLFVFTVGASRTQKAARYQQADVCELLKNAHEDLQNEYPNEYYDCHAHSRFFKMGSLTPASAKKPS